MRRILSELPNAAKANLLAWLADVEADLVEHVKPPGQPNRTGGGQGGTASRDGEELHDDAARQGASSTFGGVTRWLDRVVACVHEDSRDPRKIERYRARTRDWAEGMVRNARPGSIPARERLKRENPNRKEEEIEQELRRYDLVPEDGTKFRGEDALDVLPDPLTITTHAGTPPNKKYATLAAIHDASKHCAFPIDPWDGTSFNWVAWCGPWADGSPGPESVSKEEYREARMALIYSHLRGVEVPRLTDDDRAGIEQLLADVAVDLKQNFVEQGAEESTVAGDAAEPAINVPPDAATRQPQPAHLRAAASYEWVCKEKPDLMPTKPRQKYTRKQWEHIHDNDCPAYRDETTGEQIDVPDFATWKRQVRAGLADPKKPKVSPRMGRGHGKTIVPASQL